MSRLSELNERIAELQRELGRLKAEAAELRCRQNNELRGLEEHVRAYNTAHGCNLFLMDADIAYCIWVDSKGKEFYDSRPALRALGVEDCIKEVEM